MNKKKRTQSPLCHTHSHTCTHSYLQFLNEHFFFLAVQFIPEGSCSSTGPETGSFPPSDSLFFLRLLLSHLSPSMSFYLHSRLFSSNSLPDRGRGAALLLRAEHRGLCAQTPHRKGWFSRGWRVVMLVGSYILDDC